MCSCASSSKGVSRKPRLGSGSCRALKLEWKGCCNFWPLGNGPGEEAGNRETMRRLFPSFLLTRIRTAFLRNERFLSHRSLSSTFLRIRRNFFSSFARIRSGSHSLFRPAHQARPRLLSIWSRNGNGGHVGESYDPKGAGEEAKRDLRTNFLIRAALSHHCRI